MIYLCIHLKHEKKNLAKKNNPIMLLFPVMINMHYGANGRKIMLTTFSWIWQLDTEMLIEMSSGGKEKKCDY